MVKLLSKRKEQLYKLFLAQSFRQQGSSVVTFLLVLPLLCGLICAIIDFGRFAYLQLELNSATQAACSNACNSSLNGVSGTAMKNKLASSIQNDPEFSRSGFNCKVDVQLKNKSNTKFDSFAYTGSQSYSASSSDSFTSREVSLKSYEVIVNSTLSCAYLTPIGAALSSAAKMGSGNIELNAHAQGIYWVG